MTQFLITGDAARNKLQTMPGGGYSTVKIELPKNWDALMAERGYRPLSEFLLPGAEAVSGTGGAATTVPARRVPGAMRAPWRRGPLPG